MSESACTRRGQHISPRPFVRYLCGAFSWSRVPTLNQILCKQNAIFLAVGEHPNINCCSTINHRKDCINLNLIVFSLMEVKYLTEVVCENFI